MTAERVVSSAGFDVFNPKIITVRERSRGRTSEIIRPYVPGYMFVRFDIEHEGWQRINRMPGSGVRSLMYAADEVPAAVRDEALLPLMALCRDGYVIEREADALLVAVGQTVKILEGPFAGFSGPVESAAGWRIHVLVKIFGRDTRVELKRGMYERVDNGIPA